MWRWPRPELALLAVVAAVLDLWALGRNGWPSRRSGPALAILRAESLDGQAPEGVHRPANLEDAFVALTGEEIE